MGYIEESIPACAIVSLFTDVDYLYQKLGFSKASPLAFDLIPKPEKSPKPVHPKEKLRYDQGVG